MDNHSQNTITINWEGAKEPYDTDSGDDFILAQPKLYACYGKIIEQYLLSGRQTLGRSYGCSAPDIAVQSPYISKQHGFFETTGTKVCYTAESTTNGIFVRSRELRPGEQIELHDGDELRIPVDILLICAKTKPRDMMWQAFQYACLDSLTKLQNRDAFLERFQCMPAGALCLFILDIDKFKDVNDTYGHDRGDRAIKILAGQLRQAVQNSNYLSRWGGDEFVGMLDEDMETTAGVLAKLQKNLVELKIENRFHIEISIGIVEVSDVRDKYTFEELLKQADRELYKSKEAGGNCISIYRGGFS